MNNSKKTRKMVGIATLMALICVLQLISNYIPFGPVSITLALIPMVVGAILYGPLTGFGLGVLMGIIIFTAPSTSLFWSYNIFYTIVLCIIKTGLAGLASGFIFKGIIRIKGLGTYRYPLAIVVATLMAPLINTGIFVIGTSILFQGLSMNVNGVSTVLVPSTSYGAALTASISFVVLTNFLVEFLVSAILSPSIVYITKIIGAKEDLGFTSDFKGFIESTNIKEEE